MEQRIVTTFRNAVFLCGMRCSWILIFALVSTVAVGQGRDSTRAITFGGGYGFSQTLDQFVSPMRYSGHHSFTQLGYIDPMSEFSMRFQYGQIKTGSSPFQAKALHLQGWIDYRQYFLLPYVRNYRWDIGLGWLNGGTYRDYPKLTNNNLQYEYASSLSIEFRYVRTLTLTALPRDLRIGWYASLPVVSAVGRPGYNTSVPNGFREQDPNKVGAFFRSLDIASFGSYVRAVSRLSARWPFANDNAVELNYTWDFYHISLRNRVTAGTHQLGLTLYLNTVRS